MEKRILVPISGGKDSQACLQMAVEQHGSAAVEALFCDTQFEHPKTYDHVNFIAAYYGVNLYSVSRGSVGEKVLKYKRFPDWRSRHCTDELKLKPTRDFLKGYVLTGDCEVWYGMRLDESALRNARYSKFTPDGLYPPHEVLPKKYPKWLAEFGCRFRLPVLHWEDDDVFDYLNGMENPLYDEGFDRVGCFPCLAASPKWKDKAFNHDDFGRSQRKVVWLMEQDIGKSVYDGGPPSYDGCMTCSI